jgi:peroxiredoxin family protein
MAATNRPDVLSLVVYSGAYDKVHYALVLASGALALGSRATLFFTMDGCRALVKPDASGRPAWRNLALSQPTAKNFPNGGAMDDDFKRQRLADFEQLLAACVELGVRVIVCELGLKARGLSPEDLRGDLPIEIAGVATLLEDASKTGAMLFI